MHLAIFWGMVVLAIGTALATVDWDGTRLFFGFQFLRGGAYLLFELVLDVFGVVLLAGLAVAAYRRYVLRPKPLQMQVCAKDTWQSAYLLIVLLLIAVSGFVIEGLRLEEGYRAKAWLDQGMAVAASDERAARDEERAAQNVSAAPGRRWAWRVSEALQPALFAGDSVAAPRRLVGSRPGGLRLHWEHPVHEGIPPDRRAAEHLLRESDRVARPARSRGARRASRS